MTPPPTVTVPVSDLEYVRDPLMERVYGSPAREGVSENELRDAIALILPLAKGYAATHPVGSNQAYVDYVEGLITLATREEAPAEAGELDRAVKRMRNQLVGSATFTQLMFGREDVRLVLDTLSALRTQPPARAWGWDYEICTGCSASLTLEDIKARGTVSCCPDRRMVTVRDLVDAYEAQRKPAREDAQPVGYANAEFLRRLKNWRDAAPNALRSDETFLKAAVSGFYPVALFTHPAPDALRVAVEESARAVIEEAAGIAMTMRRRAIFNRLKEALAVLQAEQKGGA